ncbi:hypothetical protein [Candidatus Laterigemmans baculatus]|uniref:hypothetical protein n=1 Tax=Candidatus Laterigemmans baculatus TaxID=2770505 RepID=UPI0013DC93ED|nr:hypothetical protein [Candidatus Laterigemmans baculatus]
MLYRLLLLLLVCGASTSATIAQNSSSPETLPSTLSGFLQPGVRLGVTPKGDSQHLELLIFSDKHFEILQDAKIMDEEELAAKHPEFAAARDAELKRFSESLKKREPDLPPGVKYGEPRVELYVSRETLLCTVVSVGENYFLVTYGIDEVKRKAFATRFVTSIAWQDELPLSPAVSRIRAE